MFMQWSLFNITTDWAVLHLLVAHIISDDKVVVTVIPHYMIRHLCRT